MAQMTMVQAINDALKSELKRDEDVLVFAKTLVLTVVYSVLLKVYKKNLAKIEYLIHH